MQTLKILPNGLGVGRELGLCETCNIEFSWLKNDYSVLLWADKLCIPKFACDGILDRDDDKYCKSAKLFIEIAKENNYIEYLHLDGVYDESVKRDIIEWVEKDSDLLVQKMPESAHYGDEDVPGSIVVDQYQYCFPRISATYAGIKVARDLNLNCMMGMAEHHFLERVWQVKCRESYEKCLTTVYNKIFSIYLPELPFSHNYAFESDERCHLCQHFAECDSKYLADLEMTYRKIFEWHDFDEIREIKSLIDQLLVVKGSINTDKDLDDLVKMFREKESNARKKLHKRFPMINNWIKTAMFIGPVLSSVFGDVDINTSVGIAALIDNGANRLMDYYNKRYNWVNFLGRMHEYRF